MAISLTQNQPGYLNNPEDKSMARVKAFFLDESGASAVEYALLVAFIACVIVASVSVLGTKLKGPFDTMEDATT
jgi:pilus assembly protein Flp/PilA